MNEKNHSKVKEIAVHNIDAIRQDIKIAQKKATQNVFKNKRIPFRSFNLLNRSESSLGEIFTFFMLVTILLGHALKVNPFDQPSVELIKKETKKILFK